MFDDIMIYLNCLSNQRFTRQFMCVNLCFSYIILKNVVSLNFFIVLFFCSIQSFCFANWKTKRNNFVRIFRIVYKKIVIV